MLYSTRKSLRQMTHGIWSRENRRQSPPTFGGPSLSCIGSFRESVAPNAIEITVNSNWSRYVSISERLASAIPSAISVQRFNLNSGLNGVIKGIPGHFQLKHVYENLFPALKARTIRNYATKKRNKVGIEDRVREAVDGFEEPNSLREQEDGAMWRAVESVLAKFEAEWNEERPGLFPSSKNHSLPSRRESHMGVDQSKPGSHGEKDRGGKQRRVEAVGAIGADGRPDLPATSMAKFSKALLALMKGDIGNLQALRNLIIGESYTVSGRTIDGVKGEGGHTALHSAVLAEKTQIVKFLLESGCQPRTLSSNWQTALHDAILLGNHDIVMLLLEFGAPNVCLSTNAIGELPLHTAAKLFTQPNGEKIFWDILICSGLEELNRLTPSGKSVLHIAAIENYSKMIRILLDPSRNGPRAFVNVASTDGTTPLHMAIAKGHRKSTQVLLNHGADPNATNFFGETPLHFACQCSTDHCAEAILALDTLWRKGDSKRPIDDIPTSPRSSPKLKDSNHWRLVVIEAKDFGLNLPLHYAAGWIPNYSRKMGESKQQEVFGPFVTSSVLEPAPGSTSSSSASSSSVPSSTKLRRATKTALDGENFETASSAVASSSNAASSSAHGSNNPLHSSKGSSKSHKTDPTAATSSNASSHHRSGSNATAPVQSIHTRSLSLKLIERMLDLEMRHSRHPLYRKYAFSIVTPNRAGYTPMQIAEENQDTELVDLFREYAPPECEIPDHSEFLQIQLASDIHLECLAHDQPSGRKMARKLVGNSKAKYVALLGDIGIAVRPYYKDFLIRLSKRYTNVFVLYGNHEFYHSTTREALETIETVTKEYPNVIWLRAGHSFEVEGVKIVGDTLWSHLAEDEVEAVGYHLSDYRHIEIEDSNATGGKRKLTTADTMAWHQEQLAFIKQEIEKSKKKNQPVVVMTHHAPLMRLGVTNPGLWESSESEVNSAFCTDLSSMMGSPVVAWLYGHTHWNHNMVINDTLIAANQGGYIFGETPMLPTNYDPKFTVRVLKQLPTGHKWAPSATPNLH